MVHSPGPAVVAFRQTETLTELKKKNMLLQATHEILSLLPPHSNDDRIFMEWVKGRLAGINDRMHPT